MDPWMCALLISFAGAAGGVVNALLSDNGFILPRKESGILCPGFLTNVFIGAFAAFASWSFYGSGAGIELAKKAANGTVREEISLTFSALAGALLVGVAGAKWVTGQVNEMLLKTSVKVAAQTPKDISTEKCDEILSGSPRKVLQKMTKEAISIAK
ncbi:MULTISPECIES: hypothetical protein [Nostoc]|uniref:Fluoride ion transporter CrcB n=2 Tax=Nostoc TaxID=1177 RepID=A0ABR8I9P7_9NOSO|nr:MULTISPECIES: hypothetical protein [Nostoc]MBD2561725.1 hypothetical protein [Nostoc linckia FACHB-391]MBD2647373.1 hypothetical protein [Nostoc foliaceum FACHB-393]